jgi:penicillin-binding protein 2
MLSAIFPSMFHRRLLLLGGAMGVGVLLPAVQVARLGLLKGESLRERAESRLVSERVLFVPRGGVFDRKGRALAVDRPSYGVAFDYAVVTGRWAATQAARRARQVAGRGWAEMSSAERFALAEEQLPEFEARLERAWADVARIGGVDRAELEARRNAVIEAVCEEKARTTRQLLRVRAEKDAERAEGMMREVSSAEVDVTIAAETAPHVLLRGISDEARLAFSAFEDAAGTRGGVDERAIPGLHVVDSSAREYPCDELAVTIDRAGFPGPLKGPPVEVKTTGVTTHVVGTVRRGYTREDEVARAKERAELRAAGALPPLAPGERDVDRGSYRVGDRAGRSGVERSQEYTLRGQRGVLLTRVDTGEVERIDPVPAKDVHLTIDVVLQARVQALLDPALGLARVQPWHNNKEVGLGEPLAAAAVVLEVDSGDVLALVSTPTFTRETLEAQPEEIFSDPIGRPFVNRAIGQPFPPGSIVKPLIFCAAATQGVFEPSERISCQGHLYPNEPNRLQCWVWKQREFRTTHDVVFGHALDATDALMVSCNIFFYTLGRSLGPAHVSEWYGRFGVGVNAEHPHLGLGPQWPGHAGAPEGTHATSPTEATLMGIGQGPVDWTPLHAADAYATLARGGVRIVPRLRRDEAARSIDLRLNQRGVAMAMEGLRKSVNEERGTGHHVVVPDAAGVGVREKTFNVPGVVVWGKSGTADAPPILGTTRDEEGNTVPLRGPDGKAVKLRDGDHSWLVCMVGGADEGRPRFVVAVVVEYGGSGGRVAGPIANQVVAALKAEGYL